MSMNRFHWGISKFVGLFLIIVATAIFSKVLAFALLVLFLLSVATLFLLKKFHFFSKEIVALFCIVTFVYLGATLAIHYANFYPFGGGEGDQRDYHQAAVQISDDFRHGIFSFQRIKQHLSDSDVSHFYPVFIGAVYALTVQDKLVGKMVSMWFVVLSALVLYALVLQLGGSKKAAFLIGISPIFYPSYLYFGSLLLREGVVTFLALLSCLLMLKMLKKFSFALFFLFYFALGLLTHFRFYLGFVALFAFIFLWFFIYPLELKKKLVYGLFIIPALGFIPQFAGHGYYALQDITYYTRPAIVVAYRENGDSLARKEMQKTTPQKSLVSVWFKALEGRVFSSGTSGVAVEKPKEEPSQNLGSTFVLKVGVGHPITFVKNYIISYTFMLLGPFPWQIRYARQLFVLLEMIPWWVAVFFIGRAIARFRLHWKMMMPILLVAAGMLAEMALVLNSYGTYMRIRMPIFLLLLTLLPFAFAGKQRATENG